MNKPMNNFRKLLTALIFTAAFMLLPFLAAIPAQAEATDNSIEYTGDTVTFTKADGSAFGMFAPQDGTTIAIEGQNVVIHYVPKNKTTYNGIHWGLITDESLTKDVAANDDGSFDITLPQILCGHGVPVAPIKAKDGATTGDQYYLCIPRQTKALTVLEGEGMFKVVTASLNIDYSGLSLQFALSGSGYHYLYKGNYEEAVANGDNRETWINGYENSNKKWEFVMPIDETESVIPVVSISQSYLNKYENGENPLARAFFPRQLIFDIAADTITYGDYKETVPINITNNTKLFNPTEAALTTTGGPNSNNYNIELTITMADDSYDAMFIGDKASAGAADDKAIIKLSDKKSFAAEVEKITTAGDPSTIVSILESPFTASFRDKETKVWRERTVLAKKTDKTIVFDTLDENQAKAENAEALIKEAQKDYPTAAQKQAAVDAAKKAYDALDDAQKEKLNEQLPDAAIALSEAQKAADAQKAAEEKANDDKEDSKDTPKTDTPKVGDTANVGKFVFKVASAKNATLVKPVKKTNKKVTIPTSVKIKGKSFKVTAIANNAFKNNKKLTKIVVPASVTAIGKNAFKGCTAAKSITIGKKVKTIGASAFFGCKKAKKLIIKGTAIKKFGKKAFAKTGIKKLIVSNKKKKAAYKKKLIKAGMSKKAK